MNLVEGEAKFRCGREASERLIGLCDDVAFEVVDPDSTDGIARVRFSITAEKDCLSLTEEVARQVREAILAADADLGGNMELRIGAEALVEIDGQWHRRGAPFPIA